MPSAVDVIRANRSAIVDRLTAVIQERIPQYAITDVRELRANIDLLFDDFASVLEHGTREGLREHFLGIANRRVQQNFAPADYVRAVHLAFPVLRAVMREAGPSDDPEFARAFTRLEETLHDMAAIATGVLIESTARLMRAKNEELARLNEQLRASEKALSLEVREAIAEVERMGEFNRRVVESLSSGLMVIDAKTWNITHYTTRMEEILGIPTEQALGHSLKEILASIRGLEADPLVATFRTLDYLPLTKLRLDLPNGRQRTVFLRARRMFDPEGQPVASVLIIDDVSEKELLLDSFSRYVSRDLLRRLLARNQPLGLEGERRTATVLFADIRGFTGLAEKLPPEKLHAILNDYFRVMIEGIAGFGGFVDKFVGDMVMALFVEGSPIEAATNALKAARRIKKNLREVAGGTIDVGIGVNTGEVLLGNIGTEERMDFTAIGDTVNVANRLEALARGGEVLVGEPTVKLVGNRFEFRDRGDQEIRGRQAVMRAWELVLGDAPSAG